MTDPDDERLYWDERAAIDPERAAWDEDGDGIDACLDQVVSAIPIHHRYLSRLLDLGCGPGRLLIPLSDLWRTCEFVGVDISPQMLRAAAAKVHEDDIQRVTFRLSAGRSLPDGIGTFQAAWSVLLFQHLPDEAVWNYISSVSEHLVSSGIFVFQFVEGPTLAGGPFSYQRPQEMMQFWCQEFGMEVIDVVEAAVHPSWCWMTARKI